MKLMRPLNHRGLPCTGYSGIEDRRHCHNMDMFDVMEGCDHLVSPDITSIDKSL